MGGQNNRGVGDWLLPASVWKADHSIRVHASADHGQTFSLRGTANVRDPATRGPDEPTQSLTFLFAFIEERDVMAISGGIYARP